MRRAAAILAFGIIGLLTASPPSAAQILDGQAAFDAQDFAEADRLWRAEAAQGSASAMLGLGLLRDLGLGGSRDPAGALRWYLEAANLGLAEAQFNVGVMLDSGIGLNRQPLAAAAWYGRAAAGGNARASYNLGLLFAEGDGVDQNTDLARFWLSEAASSLSAARLRLESLEPADPQTRALFAPTPLGGGIVEAPRPRVELAWAARPGPEGTGFHVQIARRPDAAAATDRLISEQTQASAVRIDLDDTAGQLAWRVFRLSREDGRYASGPWQVLQNDGGTVSPPQGLLQILHAPDDAAAGRFAEELRAVFDRAGFWTDIRTDAPEAPAASAVSHAFAQDADLAAAIAAFLPGLSGRDVRSVPDASASPGMVVVTLVGGPAS